MNENGTFTSRFAARAVPEASRKAAPSIADFNITDRMMNLHNRDPGFGIRDSGLESGLEIRVSIDGDE